MSRRAWASNLREHLTTSSATATKARSSGAKSCTPTRDTPPPGRNASFVHLLRNDGGNAFGRGDGAVPCRVFSFDQLLQTATEKLNLPWPARRVFTIDGLEVLALEDIQHGMELIVSRGEEFKPIKMPRQQRHRRTAGHSTTGMDAAIGQNSSHASPRDLWRAATSRASASDSQAQLTSRRALSCTSQLSHRDSVFSGSQSELSAEDQNDLETTQQRFADIRQQSRKALRHENFL